MLYGISERTGCSNNLRPMIATCVFAARGFDSICSNKNPRRPNWSFNLYSQWPGAQLEGPTHPQSIRPLRAGLAGNVRQTYGVGQFVWEASFFPSLSRSFSSNATQSWSSRVVSARPLPRDANARSWRLMEDSTVGQVG